MYTTEQAAKIFDRFMIKLENSIEKEIKNDNEKGVVITSDISNRWKHYKNENNELKNIGNKFPHTSMMKHIKNRSGWKIVDKEYLRYSPTPIVYDITIQMAKSFVECYKKSGYSCGLDEDEFEKLSAYISWYEETPNVPFPVTIGKFNLSE